MSTASPEHPTWWKEATVYQIYPRSFKDSNGDGLGDIPGIIEKLDYLSTLGINVIWLSPHFDSPNVDNGYDIRDYRKVLKEFGSMADFDQLLSEMKQREMRLVIDLVVNHSSDEHEWFEQSRQSKDNPYRDFYIWRDGNSDGGPPNNYASFFSGSAWSKDDRTGQYYLHYFADKQPDLNWENPSVREEVYSLMKFWLDKGVAGFRMDVIPLISKQPDMPELTPEQLHAPEYAYANGPHLHDYLQEMNREVLSKYDVMTVGEAFGITYAETPALVGRDRNELNMIFHFDLVRLDRDGWRKTEWTLPELKEINRNIYEADYGEGGWGTTFLTNHDNPRAVSHFGNDSAEWRELSAKALATMMFTLKGTPYVYQGDELGMTNFPLERIDDYQDIEVKRAWQEEVVSGQVSAEEFLESYAQTSRDNARTPMQWSAESQAGFTTADTPWFAVNPNYRDINAENQQDNPLSVYHFYRQLIALRRATPALIYGDYHDLAPQDPNVYSYTRALGDQHYMVAINFTEEEQEAALPSDASVVGVSLSNYPDEQSPQQDAQVIQLQPWQAVVVTISA